MKEQVQISEIKVLNPAGLFAHPFKLRIEFKVNSPLVRKLEWKIIYVGSAESYKHDQILDHFFMVLDSPGARSVDIDVEPPDPLKIPSVDDLVGATVLMICALYRSQEFFRCSYFVYNNFDDKSPPPECIDEKDLRDVPYKDIRREILHDQAILRQKDILWDDDFNEHVQGQSTSPAPGKRKARSRSKSKNAGTQPKQQAPPQ